MRADACLCVCKFPKLLEICELAPVTVPGIKAEGVKGLPVMSTQMDGSECPCLCSPLTQLQHFFLFFSPLESGEARSLMGPRECLFQNLGKVS